jgi:cytochrome oxidase Cu insertion factor (SCO1/SenC/PrrC family)
VAVVVIGVAAIAGLWYVAPSGDSGKATIRSSGAAAIGGPFHLTDDTGQAVTDKTYAGKYMLVYFGYTFCSDICPTELQAMSRAVALLGHEARSVRPLFITVDPQRDTVQEMADYVAHFAPAPTGLTGTPDEIAAVAKAYRVYYRKEANGPDADNYVMDHTSLIYLMGPDGAYIDNFPPGTKPAEMAERIKAIIGGAEG